MCYLSIRRFACVNHAISDRLSLGTVVGERVCRRDGQLLSRGRCPLSVHGGHDERRQQCHWKNVQPIQYSSPSAIHQHERIETDTAIAYNEFSHPESLLSSGVWYIYKRQTKLQVLASQHSNKGDGWPPELSGRVEGA